MGGPAAAAGLLLPALISAGGGLLSGIFGGMARKGEQKREYKLAFENWEKMRNRRYQDLMQSPLRPETPYYAIEQDLPAFDLMLKRLALGRMGDIFGDRLGGYGINLQDILGGLGQTQSTQGSSPIPRPYQGAVNQLSERRLSWRRGRGEDEEDRYAYA
jgi:hypothetical protein